MRKPALFILAVLTCLTLQVAAQDAPATQPAAGSKWTAEDLIYSETASQFRISPDGKWAVWVKSTADKEKDRRAGNLVLSSLIEKNEIPLTRGNAPHSRPRWSADGKRIAFLSSRPLPNPKPDLANTQIWLINPAGGEPWPLTEFERGVEAFEWVGSDTIIFSAEEDPSLYEREAKRKKDDSRVVEDAAHKPPVRLFRLDVKEKKVTRLTSNDDWIQSWAVSHDGKRAVALHARSLSYQWDQKTPPVTFLHDLENGTSRELLAGEKLRPSSFDWTLEDSGFYFTSRYSSHPIYTTASISLVYFYDAQRDALTKVDLGWDNGVDEIHAVPGGFAALLVNGVRNKPAMYTRTAAGWEPAFLEGAHAANIFSIEFSADARTVVYEYSTASTPRQLFAARREGTRLEPPLEIAELNAGFQKKSIAKSEVLRWNGALDEEVEGILYYPLNYSAGTRYPLVLSIHGGPAGADLDAWSQGWSRPISLLNQRGAFVLNVNYHGSSNYGLKWVESICCGKYYDLEIPDIEKGVDSLIAKGLVDADRIATMGWSNGSILSIQLAITNPDRYKVVAAGAGDVEWISDWANVDFGQAFDTYYFGKSPLEDPELYIRKSPLFKMDRVKAPTLIFFGTEDRNVPTSQGWTHYRALSHLGKVPVRFVLFPGESHGPQKLTHQIRKVEEEMKWFDRYFFKTETDDNEAFKKDSPLAVALKRHAASRVGDLYGVAVKLPVPTAKRGARAPAAGEILTPEVVKRGEIEIGRFEVTRAQYAAFDPQYKFEPGSGNFPSSGITLENARKYVEWLSKLTGQQYRLPGEDEARRFYKPTAGENTLDFWAGYAPNPDDAERLASKLRALGETALLREVGSFRADGSDDEEAVFDLGGNVAEWVVAKDGSGKPAGGSADRPSDSKAASGQPGLAYTGLRVVRVPNK